MAKRSSLTFRNVYWPVLVCLILASALATRKAHVTSHTRLLFVLTFASIMMGAIVFVAKRIKSRPRLGYVLACVLVSISAWAVFADRQQDIDGLRAAYVQQLSSFRGTQYAWGGESKAGIDCSGLARTSLWQAMLERGIAEANPRLLGPTLWKFWWRDMSARALHDGCYGYTRAIDEAPELAGYDTSGLKAGDLAVTVGGVHVLIYFGKGQWIDASPDDQKVVANKAPADSERPWFKMPVKIMRWWILDNDWHRRSTPPKRHPNAGRCTPTPQPTCSSKALS
jgi:cell wall-associated NlpC family hydrolase